MSKTTSNKPSMKQQFLDQVPSSVKDWVILTLLTTTSKTKIKHFKRTLTELTQKLYTTQSKEMSIIDLKTALDIADQLNSSENGNDTMES